MRCAVLYQTQAGKSIGERWMDPPLVQLPCLRQNVGSRGPAQQALDPVNERLRLLK